MASNRLALLTEALYRMSYIRLDNLGISVDVSNLPATGYKQEAWQARYPSNWLRRFALWLRPAERARRQDVINFWTDEQRRQLLNAILDQGKTMAERIDDAK